MLNYLFFGARRRLRYDYLALGLLDDSIDIRHSYAPRADARTHLHRQFDIKDAESNVSLKQGLDRMRELGGKREQQQEFLRTVNNEKIQRGIQYAYHIEKSFRPFYQKISKPDLGLNAVDRYRLRKLAKAKTFDEMILRFAKQVEKMLYKKWMKPLFGKLAIIKRLANMDQVERDIRGALQFALKYSFGIMKVIPDLFKRTVYRGQIAVNLTQELYKGIFENSANIIQSNASMQDDLQQDLMGIVTGLEAGDTLPEEQFDEVTDIDFQHEYFELDGGDTLGDLSVVYNQKLVDASESRFPDLKTKIEQRNADNGVPEPELKYVGCPAAAALSPREGAKTNTIQELLDWIQKLAEIYFFPHASELVNQSSTISSW